VRDYDRRVPDHDLWWRHRGERELRELLLRWDPIGVVHEPDWPQDEYDAFLEPVAERLREGASADELAAFLDAAVREHLGLEPDAAREAAFAREVVEWYVRSTSSAAD
jgi:hypothetical protein